MSENPLPISEPQMIWARRAVERRQSLVMCGILLLAYFAMRLPNLRAVPIFCDEAIYLRWAQLIWENPAQNLFVSMVDAKLPIHYWLLALVYPLHADPVVSGRMVSVIAGAVAIPLLFALCAELDRLVPSPTGQRRRLLAPVASLLLIVCPYFAFYQRMALAESLLLTESIALAWLSLRLARLIATDAPSRTRLWAAIWLGLMWAFALLTKQNYSYLLWSLPVLAIMGYMRKDNAWRLLRRFIPLITLSTLIGVVFFIPVLFTDTTYDLRTRLIYKTYFYQSTTFSRWNLALANLRRLLFPGTGGTFSPWPADPNHPLDSGILYAYLTPPLLIVAVIGAIWMARKSAGRPLLFCGLWIVSLAAPQILLSGTFNSRYNFIGALPWLLLAAWLLASILGSTRKWAPALGGLLLVGCLAWPFAGSIQHVRDWRGATFTLQDREEYFASSGSGAAAEQAVEWIRSELATRPMTLVTRASFGVQNDYVWLRLRGARNLTMVASNTDPPLQPLAGSPYTYHVSTEPWLVREVANVPLPPERKALFFSEVAYDGRRNATYFVPPIETIAPDARVIRVFMNPGNRPNESAKCGVAMVEFTLPAEPKVVTAR